MHLSLKGSLIRSPMLNRVGQRLLQLFEGASAAYSLRDLASNIASVVRVRRASDNSEKDFSAADVSSGAMTQWVNGQVVPPLDVRELVDGERTGALIPAAAAYSLRNLSASGTSLTTVGDTQTDYFSFTGATGDTAALNGIKYEYAFLYNGAKAYNSAPPAPENTQMVRGISGNWTLFDASVNPGKAYANSTNVSTEYPWEADWTGTDLENATFSQQSTGSLVTQVRRNTDGELRSFTASEVADGTLTNWVNTSFANALPLDTASGAAAAYSLRNLSTSYTGNVVDVRRSSDDAEDSFTAAEVADGTLTDWVNGNWENVNYSTFTNGESWEDGFTAINTTSSGAGLRIPSGTTGDVITISFNLTLNSGTPSPSISLRNSAGGSVSSNIEVVSTAGSHSLTLTATGSYSYITIGESDVPSGFSISNVILNVVPNPIFDGFVTQWYDQSGNANHATQGTDASQPKIVDAGALLTAGVTFDGSNDHFDFTEISNSGAFSLFIASNITNNGGMVFGDNGGASNYVRYESANSVCKIANTEYDFGDSRDTSLDIINFNRDGSNSLSANRNAAAIGSPQTATGTFDINLIGVRNNDVNPITGAIQEIIIYNSDQSDKRQAVEENIGSNYGITLTSSKDGTVSTWYDQSGNNNHATQTDAASQPKIVDAGSLVSGGLDFDGVDDYLSSDALGASMSGTDVPFSFFHVSQVDVVATQDVLGFGRSTSSTPLLTNIYHSGGGFGYQVRDDANILKFDLGISSYSTGTKYLVSSIGSGTTMDFAVNGTLNVDNADINVGAITFDRFAIGALERASVSNFLNGVVQEIIVYPSDQSANRTAFEANIGETYGIDLPSGVDTGYDEVDGFVETWYDQSGNGNDAVQETAGSQPKIVDAGVLVTDRDGKVALNGKGATLDPPSNAPMLSSDGSYSLFAVVDFDDQRNGNEAFNNIIGFVSKTDGGASSSRKPLIYAGQDNGEVRLTSPSNPSGTASLTLLETVGVQLLTNIANPALSTGNNTGYVDGVLVSSVNSNTDVNTEILTGTESRLFDLQETTVETFLSEVIYYPSDQSANRAAIETNINNQYDIY